MQYWSENFQSWLPMEIWRVHQSSVKSDSHIQCLWTESTNSIPSQPQQAASRDKLKIYQWNDDGIHPKFLELCDLLINSDINVLAVQESKLWKVDKTLFAEGYATVPKQGKLLIFIQTDTICGKMQSFEKAGREILPICVKTTKSTWLKLYNVFLTNTTTQQNSFTPLLIKPSSTSIILDFLNRHSQLWDLLQPPASSL